ncbi:MAG TPA: tol-pal system-associated acyl-CoA thioesterase [Casimicrobiaceae bacterium]
MSAAGPSQGRLRERDEAGSEGRVRERGREADARFTFPIRVYYEDTDAAGVVYYANYLRFMERARTEWLESLGFPLAAFEREHGVAFVVHRAEVDFLQPGRLNDRLDVSVEALDRGASRLRLFQQVLRAGAPLVQGRITLACLEPLRWRPARIPPSLARVLPVAGARRHPSITATRRKA